MKASPLDPSDGNGLSAKTQSPPSIKPTRLPTTEGKGPKAKALPSPSDALFTAKPLQTFEPSSPPHAAVRWTVSSDLWTTPEDEDPVLAKSFFEARSVFAIRLGVDAMGLNGKVRMVAETPSSDSMDAEEGDF